MPLLVTDFSWSQTQSHLHVRVPLRGAAAARVDFLLTERYLKVHFPPSLLELFLFEPVDEARSSAKVSGGVAVLTLAKKSAAHWQQLTAAALDKEQQRDLREKALLEHQAQVAAGAAARAQKKQADRKLSLKTMMQLEGEQREHIQQLKDQERARTSAELQAWQEKQRSSAHSRQAPSAAPPAPRVPGHILVSFTPRVFPTALRESRVAEEEEWLRKQAQARRALAGEDAAELPDLSQQERSPDWLKEKGDKCFASGNFQAALNAYDLAIRLNPRLPALHSNRAACHLKLHNFHKVVESSSRALDLLTPEVRDNAAARARAHVRRGSAFCQLELFAEGLLDFQAALKIEPNNRALQCDAQKIRDIIQGTTDAGAC
ncbi:dynein assembly factor 4, axonemal [Synchiropus splendidus]|uniref:dynein assembly factor 4, axonemal n=1 Tax=Synchiropus splendidus TaxID=270530 RepID=UPI00237E9D92|nr:dynein assembly factor 4, axonemal [Synchiropus splendidus]